MKAFAIFFAVSVVLGVIEGVFDAALGFPSSLKDGSALSHDLFGTLWGFALCLWVVSDYKRKT